MSMIKKIATAGAVAAMGLGLSAASASAYAISGISTTPYSYTSTPAAGHTFTVGGTFVVRCSSASFAGVADGTATTSFKATYTGCTFLGFPATVTTHGNWSITATGGSAPNFTGQIDIPSTSSVTISVPIAGCNVTVPGGQTFVHGVGSNVGQAVNTGTGVNLTAVANGITYTAAGCPFSSGSNGVYNTNGATTIPGIVVS